jgi:hypothetical protein
MTNVRMDHIDQMGTTIDQIAARSRTPFPRWVFFTAEHEQLPILRQVADNAPPMSKTFGNAVTDDEIRGFSYIEHHDNVALRGRVRAPGVDRALPEGHAGCHPDPGACASTAGRPKASRGFYNVFAANDPDPPADLAHDYRTLHGSKNGM